MSKDNRGIAEFLFGRIRRELLSLFLLNPSRSFYLLELVDILRTGRGGVQRELANLTAAGIITKEKSGVRTYFRVDSGCRGFEELLALVLSSRELDPILLEAIETACPDAAAAVRSGEAAPRTDSLELELVILGEADTEILRAELDRVELLTGMTIRAKVFPSDGPLPAGAGHIQTWAEPDNGILLTGRRNAFLREYEPESETSPQKDLFSSFGVDW